MEVERLSILFSFMDFSVLGGWDGGYFFIIFFVYVNYCVFLVYFFLLSGRSVYLMFINVLVRWIGWVVVGFFKGWDEMKI